MIAINGLAAVSWHGLRGRSVQAAQVGVARVDGAGVFIMAENIGIDWGIDTAHAWVAVIRSAGVVVVADNGCVLARTIHANVLSALVLIVTHNRRKLALSSGGIAYTRYAGIFRCTNGGGVGTAAVRAVARVGGTEILIITVHRRFLAESRGSVAGIGEAEVGCVACKCNEVASRVAAHNHTAIVGAEIVIITHHRLDFALSVNGIAHKGIAGVGGGASHGCLASRRVGTQVAAWDVGVLTASDGIACVSSAGPIIVAGAVRRVSAASHQITHIDGADSVIVAVGGSSASGVIARVGHRCEFAYAIDTGIVSAGIGIIADNGDVEARAIDAACRRTEISCVAHYSGLAGGWIGTEITVLRSVNASRHWVACVN